MYPSDDRLNRNIACSQARWHAQVQLIKPRASKAGKFWSHVHAVDAEHYRIRGRGGAGKRLARLFRPNTLC